MSTKAVKGCIFKELWGMVDNLSVIFGIWDVWLLETTLHSPNIKVKNSEKEKMYYEVVWE